MTDFQNQPDRKTPGNIAKYSGIAFQMLATIGVFTFAGYKIDQHRNGQPIFAAIFGFLGVVISLYMIIRSLTKNKS